MKGLLQIAKGLDCSLPQLSIAWVLLNKDVSTAIMGCSKVSQLEDNLKAVNVYQRLKELPAVQEEIEETLGNRPTPITNWKTFSPLPPRR